MQYEKQKTTSTQTNPAAHHCKAQNATVKTCTRGLQCGLSASSPPTTEPSFPDPNTSVSPGGGCRKAYWKPCRDPGRWKAPLVPCQLSRLLCHRRQSGFSSIICPWWICAGFSQSYASCDSWYPPGGYSFHNFPRNWSKTDGHIISWVLL